jgi:hypothetical protein
LASAINTAKNRSKANLENSTNIGGKITWGTVTVITNFVVPFTNVIANVFNATIEYSPLGAITALSPKGNTELEKNISRDEAMTKALIGTVALVSLLVLSSGDDDDEETIQITARGAGDYKQNYTLNEIGWQPYSIRINGTWYSYQYTPLFLALSIVGNVNDYRRYRGSEGIDADLEASLVFSLKQVIPQMFQTTFLQGLTDFAEKAMSEKPLEGGIEKLLAKQAYGFVPNIYKQAFSEYQNAFDIPEKNTSNSIRAMFVQDIPVASWGRNSLTDKINVLGDPIIPDTDKITSKVESNPLFKLLIDKQAFLVAPRLSTSKIIVDGKERPMTDEEFYNYSKARGQAMKNYLEANYAVLVEQNQSQAKKIIKKMWEKFGEQQKNILEYSLN